MSRWGQGSTRAGRKARASVLERDQHTCQLHLLGCQTRATEAHHIHGLQGAPRAQATNPDDMIAACTHCHEQVTNDQRRQANAHRLARRHLPTRPHPGDPAA